MFNNVMEMHPVGGDKVSSALKKHVMEMHPVGADKVSSALKKHSS